MRRSRCLRGGLEAQNDWESRLVDNDVSKLALVHDCAGVIK